VGFTAPFVQDPSLNKPQLPGSDDQIGLISAWLGDFVGIRTHRRPTPLQAHASQSGKDPIDQAPTAPGALTQ
jgi:hypothetical protein